LQPDASLRVEHERDALVLRRVDRAPERAARALKDGFNPIVAAVRPTMVKRPRSSLVGPDTSESMKELAVSRSVSDTAGTGTEDRVFTGFNWRRMMFDTEAHGARTFDPGPLVTTGRSESVSVVKFDASGRGRVELLRQSSFFSSRSHRQQGDGMSSRRLDK
jgi:hypothetical protein